VVALVWHRNLPRSLWFFRAAALSGVAAYLCSEAGWVTTEVGRQPWIVYNIMQVTQAVTEVSAAFVWVTFGLLFVIYVTIGITFLSLLLRLSARWRREDLGLSGPVPEPERSMPYGPREETYAGGEGGS
jgi:cytochrome bd ubiquinol oxidase subunit I